jgi:hypothetical protein
MTEDQIKHYEDLLEKNFTRSQIEWFSKYGLPVKGTDDEAIAQVARQLFDARQYDDIAQKVKLQQQTLKSGLTYDLSEFADKAGIKDEKEGDKVTRSAADILMAEWPNASPGQRELWGTGIESAYGPGAISKLNAAMDVERRNREYASKQPKVGTAGKVFGTIFAPRSLEAIESGKASGWGDALLSKNGLLDLGENAVMALPAAGYAGMLAKGARVLPKARALAAAVLGAAAAPAVVEGMDKLAYSPEENPDRSIYSFGDVGLGTATNLAAPFLLGRGASRMGKFLGTSGADGRAATGLSEEVLDILDDAVKKGEWVQPSKESVDAVSQILNTEAREAAAASKGATKLQDATTKELEATRLLNKWDEKAEEGAVSFLNGDHWKMKHDFEKANKLYDEADKLRKEAGDLDYWTKEQAERAVKNAPRNDARDYLLAGMLEKRAQDIENKGLDNGLGTSAGLLLEGAKSSDKVHGQVKDILNFSRELQNADFSDMLRYRNPNLYKAAEMAETWGVNKYGSKRDADMMTGQVSRMLGGISPSLNISKALEESKAKAVNDVLEGVKKSQASRILGQEGLSDEDRDWMRKIAENPGIVKGLGEGSSTKFKNWFLLRGQDLLRGTELFRPTPAVE